MKTFIIFFLVTLNLSLFTYSVSAQTIVSPTPVDYLLPYPGLLPDHPLYPLKKIRDQILYFFSSDLLKKAELNLLFADKKIAMAKNLMEKGKINLASATVLDSQINMVNSSALLPMLSEKNILPIGLPDKISLSLKKHQEILNSIQFTNADQKVQENIREAQKLNMKATGIMNLLKEQSVKLNK